VIKLIGSLFFWGHSHSLILITGIVLLALAIKVSRQSKQISLSLMWILISVILFSMYRGEKPEYYFLFLIPAVLTISSTMVIKLKPIGIAVLMMLFMLNSLYITIRSHKSQNSLNIRVITRIQETVRVLPVKQIVYDIKHGDDFGVKYFQSTIPIVANGSVVHITYPNSYNFSNLEKIGDAAVWVDPRTETNNYVTTNDYICETAPSYQMVPLPDPFKMSHSTNYQILHNSLMIGTLSVLDEIDTSMIWYESAVSQKNQHLGDWVEVQPGQYLLITPRLYVLFESKTVKPESLNFALY
jgi:hypothetical protein